MEEWPLVKGAVLFYIYLSSLCDSLELDIQIAGRDYWCQQLCEFFCQKFTIPKDTHFRRSMQDWCWTLHKFCGYFVAKLSLFYFSCIRCPCWVIEWWCRVILDLTSHHQKWRSIFSYVYAFSSSCVNLASTTLLMNYHCCFHRLSCLLSWRSLSIPQFISNCFSWFWWVGLFYSEGLNFNVWLNLYLCVIYSHFLVWGQLSISKFRCRQPVG